MRTDFRLLSYLVQTLDEGGHPVLKHLGELLRQTPPDLAELRRLGQLLAAAPIDDLAPHGESLRRRISVQVLMLALDRDEEWFSPTIAQQQLTNSCRALRLHGLVLPEALVALLGAQWLQSHDPGWALEMARRAARILENLDREAKFQGRSHRELKDALREAKQLIRKIVHGSHDPLPEEPSKAEETPEPMPSAPMPPEGGILAPKWPLRPARLFLASFTLLPDTHPRAGDLQFLDPQTTGRLFDEAEVLIEALEVGGRIYHPYVEKDMEPIVPIRPEQVLVLRVEGDSMQNAGIQSGDLILARRVMGTEARNPSFWNSLKGRLVLAVLLERYQTETHQAFLIKRLAYRNGRWWLCSENPNFEEIPLDPGLHELHPVLAILKPGTM